MFDSTFKKGQRRVKERENDISLRLGPAIGYRKEAELRFGKNCKFLCLWRWLAAAEKLNQISVLCNFQLQIKISKLDETLYL